MDAPDITLNQEQIPDVVLESEVTKPSENIDSIQRNTAVENEKPTGKEEIAMPEPIEIKISREQLYNEIWEISVTGVAQKYNLPYAQLLKLCKEADIPIPPSGYWTKISFGKPAVKASLPDSDTDIITLSNTTAPRVSKKKATEKGQGFIKKRETVGSTSSSAAVVPEEHKMQPYQVTSDPENELSDTEQVAIEEKQEVESVQTYTQWGHTYNIYEREILYNEVWEKPVIEVAKKYGVSDVTIHKICKSLDIPTPPLGYWAKVYAGKAVTRIPLPKSDKPVQKSGIRTGLEATQKIETGTLDFLEEEERAMIFAIANQIQLPDERAKMHPKIIAHRRLVAEWNKSNKRANGPYRGSRYSREASPFLADSVSEETLPRVFHIMDALIRAMEPLGCSLTDDLQFVVLGENVSLMITESMDEFPHINTKEENMQLLKYEEERKRYSYASRPNIRKYDHNYNGRLSITVYNLKNFRDCKSYVVEDKLGDILILMYETSNILRKEREAREEAERKREEEERLREEHRNRYNEEVDRTIALTNLAEDYDTACKIRHYISAVEATKDLDEKTLRWIEWAKAKADWFDPTIVREDELLGKRDHEEDADQKKLEHARHSWW